MLYILYNGCSESTREALPFVRQVSDSFELTKPTTTPRPTQHQRYVGLIKTTTTTFYNRAGLIAKKYNNNAANRDEVKIG
jgi:hypothetical protein